jgi:hypothetical protein
MPLTAGAAIRWTGPDSAVSGRFCFLCCASFQPELMAAVAAEGWSDVDAVAAPARCGRPPLSWDELRQLLPSDCTQAVIFGRICLKQLDAPPPAGWPQVRVIQLAECFHLVADAALVAKAIARGAYMLTPGWLDGWREHIQAMGFDENGAAPFFQDFARELVLLDTGVGIDTPEKFDEFAKAMGVPAIRVAVGIERVRLLAAALVAKWRVREERRQAAERAASILAGTRRQ